jgi:glyoxylase-like metal-dependent hydrolase (beta-lactamase superfamily II)
MLRHRWFSISQIAPREVPSCGVSLTLPALFSIGELGHSEEVFSYFIVGQDRAILIDSGMGLFAISEAVEQILGAAHIRPPIQVLNTHSDFDHVGSNHEFEQVALLEHPISRYISARGYRTEELQGWIAAHHFAQAPPCGMANPYHIPPFPHATFFSEGERFLDRFLNLRVIHTPGHTDDSVCLFESNQGWLFVGDLLYSGPIYIQKVGGLRKYRESLQKLLSISGVRHIFSSHIRICEPISLLHEVYERVVSIKDSELVKEVVVRDGISLVPVE